MTESTVELVGLALMAIGAALIVAGVAQVLAWLAWIVAGVFVLGTGLVAVVIANRSDVS